MQGGGVEGANDGSGGLRGRRGARMRGREELVLAQLLHCKEEVTGRGVWRSGGCE